MIVIITVYCVSTRNDSVNTRILCISQLYFQDYPIRKETKAGNVLTTTYKNYIKQQTATKLNQCMKNNTNVSVVKQILPVVNFPNNRQAHAIRFNTDQPFSQLLHYLLRRFGNCVPSHATALPLLADHSIRMGENTRGDFESTANILILLTLCVFAFISTCKNMNNR